MRRAKQSILGAAAALLALGFGGVAHGASIDSLLFTNELNQLSDNSAEFLINADGTLSDGTCWTGGGANLACVGGGAADAILDAGDRLRGTFDIGSIEDLTGGGGSVGVGIGSSNNELSGLFDFTVVAKFDNGDALPTGALCTTTNCFVFAPTSTFASEVGGIAGSTGVAVWEDSTLDYARTGGAGATKDLRIQSLEATATGGVLRMLLGFAGDGDELFIANTVSDDVGDLGATAPPGNAGTTNFQFSILFESFGHDFEQVGATIALADGLIDLNGSGNVLGIGGVNTPFDFFDNFDLVVRPVPEPAFVGLIGMGLLGFGMAHWRRRRA